MNADCRMSRTACIESHVRKLSFFSASTASVERTFSAVKRMETSAATTTGQSGLSSLAWLAIEKDLLLELEFTDN